MDTSDTGGVSNGGAPKKFIRTFAGDMDVFQRGGTPDLAPLKEHPVLPEEGAAEASATESAASEVSGPASFPAFIPVEAPAPIPVPVSKPVLHSAPIRVEVPAPVTEPEAEVFHFPKIKIGMTAEQPEEPSPEERLVEASPVAPEIIEIPPVEAPEPAKLLPPIELEPQPARLQTYAGDFSGRMKETHASAATVLAAEQDAASGAPQVSSGEIEKKNRWVLPTVAGVLLLIVSGVGVYFAYSRYATVTAPVVVAPTVSMPIFVDSREQVSGAGVVLQQAIAESVGKSLPINTVRLLTLDPSTITDKSVFTALNTRAPGILIRNIDTTNSMAGVVNTSSGTSPFFILSVSSYSASFSGMLSWEPLMQSDFATLFPLYSAPTAIVATSTATAISTTTMQKVAKSTPVAPTAKAGFRDEVVSNHDVRVYRDEQNRSILLYGYWDQATLIIARDPVSFAEILGRLATSHTK